MRVFHEDWQTECRGTPFAVGDAVDRRTSAPGPEGSRAAPGGPREWW
ncbi:DUF6578 domain-containing protein [Streptomyces sp. NPDC040750]